ncbi:hypothetical protein AVT69_gp284 [Pseudomonas phage PhiPA3]|uniref:Uncharacterized protein 286 n=1 Tax=Pseudomonas phage PhiPA3 TaxID=998086 RepID=F8SJC2_BPPA3|nr:hypothetical protein AVT69_gp284 [Pseudomonas phage PhiPA3]AEH03709.1 hypothetical protein [Pseudomonas phage PhiPA3]
MSRKVKFYSRLAAMAVTQPHYVISIGEANDGCVLDPEHKSVLRLEFDDIPYHVDGYRLFSLTDARRILRWLRDVPENETVIVHCEAGVSRSAAVAQFMVDHQGYELEKDQYCNGSFLCANGHVYGTLRMTALEITDQYLLMEAEYDRKVKGIPQW